MSDDLISKRRADQCTTHSHACDCREYAHAQEIERLRAEVEGLREQHGRDSAELRRLCAARDEQRDGRLSALERAVVAERERDAQRARAERAEARISDAPVGHVDMSPAFDAVVIDELDATLVQSTMRGKRVALVVVND